MSDPKWFFWGLAMLAFDYLLGRADGFISACRWWRGK
jgi:hypothetical protein